MQYHKPIKSEAIFDLTKFFYLTTEKETAFKVGKTHKDTFISVSSIRYLNYKIHPSPKDDISKLSLTDNTINSATKSNVYAQTTHQIQCPVKETKSASRFQHKSMTKSMSTYCLKAPPTQTSFSDNSNSLTKPLQKLLVSSTKSKQFASRSRPQVNTKIVFQSTSVPSKVTTTSYPQEEMTPNNFPALPAIAKPTKSASGLHCSNFNDINNMKQTRSEETSQTKDPFQNLLKTYSRIEEQQSEMLDILKSLRYF